MIVVDTNVLAYLLIPGEYTEYARKAYEVDATWVAPILWRSEFRNVLTTSMRERGLPLMEARELMDVASELMRNGEYEVRSADVLDLASESGCSAYDCEFIALAKELGVPLVTADRGLATAFGTDVRHISYYS
jgi:predicted nucleic acid-binding protein